MADYGLVPVILPDDSVVKVDVIFVHGLNGHRSKTWTSDSTRCPETDPFWLQWLKEEIPSVRVWTYGYNSSAFADVSADNVAIHAETFLKALVDSGIGRRRQNQGAGSDSLKITFVGHSLGGIMIKLIMVKASQPGLQYSYIFENTPSVVFLGSPHRGSIWANRLYNLQKWLPSRQDNNFVGLLRPKPSSRLADIAAQFNSCWGERPVYTVRETKSMHGISMIVKLEDAKTHCKNEEVTDVDRDHRSISKPLSRDDVLYKYIIERIDINRPTSYSLKGEIDKATLLPAARRKETGGIRAIQSIGKYFSHERLYPDAPRLLRWELFTEAQDENDLVTSVDLYEGATYTASYDYGTGAGIVLEIKRDLSLEWTIYTPMSLFYPGKHYGRLILSADYPFKPPKVIWDSPLASPYINTNGRVSTTGELESDYSPQAIWMDQLFVNLAAIAVYGPGFFGHSEAIQGAYKPWHWHLLSIWSKMLPHNTDTTFAETLPADWVISLTNFFSRNLNSLDEEEIFDPEPLTPIIPAQSEQSIVAIDACVGNRTRESQDEFMSELGDYRATFTQIQTFGEWRKEEKRCALILAPSFEVLHSYCSVFC